MTMRMEVEISGVVQGVGFRPFVFGLASRLGLGGFIRNNTAGVMLEIEGSGKAIAEFLCALRESPPPLARITGIKTKEIESKGEPTFAIYVSQSDGSREAFISPDIATCKDCLMELHDPSNRRYRYPFINCTNCGPRYTIIRDIPYDRTSTTMKTFPLCENCRNEYIDPVNRRFHAEAVCCRICGPRVEFCDQIGNVVECADPIEETILRLCQGQIVAIKGLGGFHLACDAANVDAVRLLRRRKNRDHKPFAVMVKDMTKACDLCDIPKDAAVMLSTPERPILLLPKRSDHALADETAPYSATFGIMLPYTPLHELIMQGAFRALVMTSGNISDEPIAYTNEDALKRLAGLADGFLFHDRDIHIRTDDSVVRPILGMQRFLRRSRGYAPFPVHLSDNTMGHEILAVGPELSNTICITRGNQAFMSHHLGDLGDLAAYEAFTQAVIHFKNLLGVEPRAIACDLHPNYASTRYAHSSALPLIFVQHHHAHIASVLAEHSRSDKVIGVSFDGLGWGEAYTAQTESNLSHNTAVWGGEFMICDLKEYHRVGHLTSLPQPGGDATAKRPDRMAYIYLRAAFGDQADDIAAELLPRLNFEEIRTITQMIEHNVNCPYTSSAGRLFDAASALLGICHKNTYHSQAPMELEGCAAKAPEESGFYAARILQSGNELPHADAADIIRAMVEDFHAGTPRSVCAARFHNSIAQMVLAFCDRIRSDSGLTTVALGGGVMANAFLLERLSRLLSANDFEVLLNSIVSAGDGGVSLGQAAVAARRLACV